MASRSQDGLVAQGVTPCNGYRAYNPTLMRFHSPDNLSPFGGGGLSPYGYCLGDPVNRTDPTGHLSWEAGLGIGLGVLGLGYGGYVLAYGALAALSGISAASAAVMVATPRQSLAMRVAALLPSRGSYSSKRDVFQKQGARALSLSFAPCV